MPRNKYISIDYVADDLLEFEKIKLLEISAEVGQKYQETSLPEAVIAKIESLAFVCLRGAIYYDYHGGKLTRSYQNQLAIIYDFKRLLDSEDQLPRYIHTTKSRFRHIDIRSLLNEGIYYREHGSLSHFFFHCIGLKNHELTQEQTLKIIDFAREITEQLIQEITTMALEHMETFVPNEVRAYEARTEELLVTSTEPVSATI